MKLLGNALLKQLNAHPTWSIAQEQKVEYIILPYAFKMRRDYLSTSDRREI